MADKLLPKITFPNKPAEEMIIGAYVEPLVFGKFIEEYHVKIGATEAYDDLKAANFNTLLQCMTQLNKEDNAFTLEMFEQTSRVKMSFLFRDHEIVGDKNIVTEKTDKELKEYFEKNYKPLAERYSSFAGIHFIDEPGYKDWKRAKEIKSAFKSVFPDKLFFLNLLQVYAPHWAFPNGPIYMPDAKWWIPDDPDYIAYSSHKPRHIPLWKTGAEYRKCIDAAHQFAMSDKSCIAKIRSKFKLSADDCFACSDLTMKIYDLKDDAVMIEMASGEVMPITAVAHLPQHPHLTSGRTASLFYVYLSEDKQELKAQIIDFINRMPVKSVEYCKCRYAKKGKICGAKNGNPCHTCN